MKAGVSANAACVFNADTAQKQAQRKGHDLEKKNDQMLKTIISQLTLERNFLLEYFRKVRNLIPQVPDYDSQN